MFTLREQYDTLYSDAWTSVAERLESKVVRYIKLNLKVNAYYLGGSDQKMLKVKKITKIKLEKDGSISFWYSKSKNLNKKSKSMGFLELLILINESL